jgi:hypothetical protein
MAAADVTVRGVVSPDGHLQLIDPLNVPPGEVQVSIMSLDAPPQPGRFWSMMSGIWSDLQAAGRTARTRQEIDAQINALRDDAEQEAISIEKLQAGCRNAASSEGKQSG